jgi:wyosine [tRNA(Phe)-imidazoG37] synthetase (radical SAM superfamily)
MSADNDAIRPLITSHPRQYAANRYVYPVLSRRARGISIGVNLTLDKRCNFGCVYCQVDRTTAEPPEEIDLDRLRRELDAVISQASSGRLFESRFAAAPEPMRRLNDIAVSGDAEPTTCPRFAEAIEVCAAARCDNGLDDVKLVLITNATQLHQDRVRRGLEVMDRNNGEVWAKLDAGTPEAYTRINRSAVPFDRILANIRQTARHRPIVIQSLFMRVDGQPPTEAELSAYAARLTEITAAGGQVKLVQVYTVSRPPAESFVASLADAEVDAIAQRVRDETGLPVEAFYG